MTKIVIIESPLTGVQIQVEGATLLVAVGILEVAQAIMLSGFKVQAQPAILKNDGEVIHG